ncbi:MAG: hypothetical protein ABSF18_05305, partial [Gammaproteobacteria bacterium]
MNWETKLNETLELARIQQLKTDANPHVVTEKPTGDIQLQVIKNQASNTYTLQIQGKRPYQEDRASAALANITGLSAVKDNHKNAFYARALQTTFMNLQKSLSCENYAFEIGSTAAMSLQVGKDLYTAGAGDTSCYLSSETEIQQLTVFHNPDPVCNPLEVARIEKAGGFIKGNRLNGQLAVSRGFGDNSLQNSGLSACPDITHVTINNGNKLIHCTDGVNDCLPSTIIQECVIKNPTQERAARAMINCVVQQGAHDNATVQIATLQELPQDQIQIFCMFDGHGHIDGHLVSEFLNKNAVNELHKTIEKQLNKRKIYQEILAKINSEKNNANDRELYTDLDNPTDITHYFLAQLVEREIIQNVNDFSDVASIDVYIRSTSELKSLFEILLDEISENGLLANIPTSSDNTHKKYAKTLDNHISALSDTAQTIIDNPSQNLSSIIPFINKNELLKRNHKIILPLDNEVNYIQKVLSKKQLRLQCVNQHIRKLQALIDSIKNDSMNNQEKNYQYSLAELENEHGFLAKRFKRPGLMENYHYIESLKALIVFWRGNNKDEVKTHLKNIHDLIDKLSKQNDEI